MSNASLCDSNRDRYLDLLIQCLCGVIYKDGTVIGTAYDPEARREGTDWPASALTMIGLRRLGNLRQLVETVLRDGVPGDLIEAGVWRGGACILMRAILAAHGVTDRTVYVADSFDGLPPPDPAHYPADEGETWHTMRALAIPREQVEANFRAYGLLDPQVAFVEGWFKDTLHTLDTSFALIRLDGDMYESTMQAMQALYPRLSEGGFCIIDDYGGIPACARAVTDYRAEHGITAPIQRIDQTGRSWRKPRSR